MSEFQRLIDLLHRKISLVDNLNVLVVGLGKQWTVWVMSFYDKLLVREKIDFLCKLICSPTMSRKMCYFTWPTSRGVILTAKKSWKMEGCLRQLM